MGWYALYLTALEGGGILVIVSLQGDFSMGLYALDLTADRMMFADAFAPHC